MSTSAIQKPQHAPHELTTPVYDQKVLLSPSSLPIIEAKGVIKIQPINGTFLYYAHVFDPCMLPVINEIYIQQAQPTIDTNIKAQILMEYTHTHPNAIIHYYASDIQLHVD